ncbi:hypothetical protein QLX08_006531 [Tetragonisca angustula]|uniref:Uncharacterized protein n=1 Tax=Tetragonisca angustula TaxID=166442 RepID=A0AAW0ZTW1_9HYME
MRTRKLDACNFATINGHERKEEQKIRIVRCSDTAKKTTENNRSTVTNKEDELSRVWNRIHAAELGQKGMSIVLNN